MSKLRFRNILQVSIVQIGRIEGKHSVPLGTPCVSTRLYRENPYAGIHNPYAPVKEMDALAICRKQFIIFTLNLTGDQSVAGVQ